MKESVECPSCHRVQFFKPSTAARRRDRRCGKCKKRNVWLLRQRELERARESAEAGRDRAVRRMMEEPPTGPESVL